MDVLTGRAVTFRPGPFRRIDALAAGYSRADVDVMVSTGLWSVLRRGVYADAHLVTSADPAARHALDVAAAALVVEEGVGSHESAARVHGLPVWPRERPVVVLSRPGRERALPARRTGPGLLLLNRHTARADRCCRLAAVVTTPARTVADLAAERELLSACVTAEAALHRDLVGAAELRTAVEGLVAQGRPAGPAYDVLAIAGPESESVLETVSWVRFHQYDVEPPLRQRWVGGETGAEGRVDFLWVRQRVVGEADGLAKYRDDAEALVREKLRQERLEQAGFTVVRWTWTEMVHRPEATIARIRAALARGGRR